MNKFFKAIAGLIQSRADFKKLAVFCILVLAGVFIIPKVACAWGAQEVADGILSFLITFAIGAGELCIKFAIFCLYFFIQLAKYNDYINVPTVQIGWTMVRDVANMFFVVVLLMIAIGTILGLEQYQWNKTLAKMVLAAVFINFSNMICGIFIDVAHIFTITFVNAVASTAGGNLVKMFNMEEMYNLIYNKNLVSGQTDFDVRLLIGAIAAFLFAFLALATMAAYLIIMVARVVVLWVLIILSPLAFILQVIPQTQSYAKQWWEKFGKQVVVAPVIVFFLWLAFATAGQGNIATVGMELSMEPLNQEVGYFADTEQGKYNETALSWAKVTTWTNMSNFLIPMALLWVGAMVAGQMGVVGGGAAAKATDFFKNVATVATGYAAGRWLAKKGWETGKKVVGTVAAAPFKFVGGQVKSGLMNVPLVGGRAWKRKWNQLDEWRRDNKIFRLIPFIGGYQDDYNNKLDERQKKQMVMSKERRYREMSYERGTLDKVGGWLDEHTGGVLGFGLKTASRRKNDEEGRLMYAKDRAEKRGKERQANVKKTLSDMSRAQLEIFMREEDAASGGMVEKWQGSKEGQEWRDKWLEDHKTTEEDVKNTPELRDQLYDATREEWAKTEEGDKFYNDKKKGQEKRYNDFMYDYKHAVPTFGLSKVPLIRRLDEARDPNKVYRKKDDAAVQSAFEEWKEKDPDNRENVSLKEFLRTEEGFDAQFEKEDRGITGGKQSKWGWWSTGLSKIDREAVTQSMGALWLEQRQLTKTEQAEQARNDAMKVFRETQIGKKMVTDIAEAGVGKKIGEDFYKAAQNAQVKLKWDEARKKLDEARKADALTEKTGGIPMAVNELMKKDKFATALYHQDEAAATTKELKAAQDQAEQAKNQAEIEAWERAGEPKEGPKMTQLMRGAGADVASKAAEEYLKTVQKNWPRFEEAADELQKMENEIKSIGEDKNLSDDEKKDKLKEKERERTDYLQKNPYASAVFYEQKAAQIESLTKEQRGRVLEQFGISKIGGEILKAAADSEAKANIGDDFVKKIKNEHWEKEYNDAKEKIEEVEEDPEELEALANKDRYVKALKLSQEQTWTATMSKVMKDEAGSAAEAAFVEKKYLGQGTPSTALDALADQMIKAMNKLDEPGRGAFAADNAANLCYAILTGTKTIAHEVGAYGVMKNLNQKGNVDDGGGGIADKLTRLRNGTIADPLEKAKVEALDKVFGEKGELDIGIKWNDKDKKYEYVSSRQGVNNYQNWALTGGDTQLVKTHAAVSKFMKANNITDYETGAQRWSTERWSKMGSDEQKTYVGSVDEMKKRTKRHATKLQEGAEGFKEDGYSTKHTENVGCQMGDSKWGGVRMSTPDEATDVVVANDRKRPGNTSKNVHSFGAWNFQKNVLEKLDARRLAAAFGSAKTYNEIKPVLDRTMDGLTGYEASQKADKFVGAAGSAEEALMNQLIDEELKRAEATINALPEVQRAGKKDEIKQQVKRQVEAGGYIGGSSLTRIKENFGDVEHMVGEVVVKQLFSSGAAFNNILTKKLENTEYDDAEEGAQNVIIASDDPNKMIYSTHLADLYEQVLTKYHDSMGTFAELLQEDGIQIDAAGLEQALRQKMMAAQEQKRTHLAKKTRGKDNKKKEIKKKDEN